MSVYSQPVNTISYSQNSHAINQPFRPKYINDSDDEKLNSTIDYQSNKLPLNLFLSGAQYNRMLITYGKNRKKNSSNINVNQITTLQYLNDPIFQKEIQKRAKATSSLKYEVKEPKKKSQNCTCCCCHEFCSQCTNTGHKCSKLSQTDKKLNQTIQHQTSNTKQKQESGLTKIIPKKKPSKKSSQKRRASSAYSKNQQNKNNINAQSLTKSQRKQAPDISHLLIKSLIQFNDQRRYDKQLRQSRVRTQKAKDEYLKMLNDKIRQYNYLNCSRVSRSKSKEKDITKNDIALHYWDQIKDEVFKSLKDDNFSQPLKNQLQNYHFTVYDHKEIPRRKSRLSKDEVNYLRQKHGYQALVSIQKENIKKNQASQRIKKNLKVLQNQRRRRIQQSLKRPFQPTAEMYRSAFQNIIDPPKQSTKKDRQNEISHFKNERIIANHHKSNTRNKNRQ